MKNYYCTLDTETVGGAIAPTGMYNLGCLIHDKEGNILASCSLLVMEHYEKIKNDDYAKRNFPLYAERLLTGELTAVATEQEAVAIVRNLCKMYNVKYVMAYNSAFDFEKTICRDLLNDFEFIDIYLMALQTLTHLKKYQIFCNEYQLFSKSGKSCSTTAETAYAFITQDPTYQEEHTALADAKIEMQIFLRCSRMHKKYTKNCHAFNCTEHKKFPSRF